VSCRTASTRPHSDFADLVLPAAIWGEKEGTYTNSERRISGKSRVPPPGGARPDFDIFLAIAEKLGVREELYPNWQTPHDAYQEWQRVSAGRMCDYSNFSWQQIDDANGLQWGGESLYRDGIFPTPDGRANLYTVPCEPFVEQPAADYDFILNTGRTVEHWHTRTKTAEVELLNHMVPNAWLEINPVDASRLDL
jgi:assimilatory nitrate reductase catalytic subunit